jgi:hypothetical protein
MNTLALLFIHRTRQLCRFFATYFDSVSCDYCFLRKTVCILSCFICLEFSSQLVLITIPGDFWNG